MRHYILFTLLLCFSSILFAGDLKTLILQPGPQDGFDAYINSVYPDQVGWDKGLLVTAWTLGGQAYIGKSLVRFDLSQLSPGDSIVSAKFSLFFDPEGSWPEQYGDNQAHIRRITGDWNYMTVTWNTQPAVSESDKIYLPQSTQPQQDYTDIDVTNYARLWQKNVAQNHGMIVSLDTETPYACLVFAPSDRDIPSVRPKLVITYYSCIPPVANFVFTIKGFDVAFKDKSTSAQSWLWKFGDGQTSTLQNPIHHYTASGTYPVSLFVKDTCGFSTFTDSVTIHCIPPKAGFYYNLDFPIYSFHDTTVSFNHLSWRWDFGDGTTSTLQNPKHIFKEQGTYRVCLVATDICSSDTACTAITFILPEAGFKMQQNDLNDLEMKFTDMTIGSTGWQWSFGDGDSSSVQNPIHIYSDYGNYLVCLKVNQAGRDSTSCGSLNLTKLKVGSCTVQLFPNPPENGLIHLIFSCKSPYANATLTDILGHKIYTKEIFDIIANNKIDILLPTLASGIYFIKIDSPDSSRLFKLVIP